MIRITAITTANFNPLPPCGGRPNQICRCSGRCNFNPLPPCGGRQLHSRPVQKLHGISIHSLRVEGDRAAKETLEAYLISIHSLRVEGDRRRKIRCFVRSLFQSTPSVWRETGTMARASTIHGFQSTPSVWRETLTTSGSTLPSSISIHSLRVEGDRFLCFRSSIEIISIHSLRVEGDCSLRTQQPRSTYFNPLPP